MANEFVNLFNKPEAIAAVRIAVKAENPTGGRPFGTVGTDACRRFWTSTFIFSRPTARR